MKAILDIIKQYKWELGFAAGAALGVVLIVFGMGGMQEVEAELGTAMRVKTEIEGMARGANPINEKAIRAEEQRIASLAANNRKVLDYVREWNLYPPLVPGAFPDPAREDRTDFRDAFRNETNAWLRVLNAGQPPTADEIVGERDRMEAERPETDLLGADPVDEPPMGRDRNRDAGKSGDELTPEQSASIRNARRSHCYASSYSFQVSEVSRLDGPMWEDKPPELEDMWRAQLEVWVQRSVVEAIAAVNQAAADKLNNAGEEAWVGNLPIKDLLSLQTTRYYIKEGVPVDSSAGGTTEKDRVYPPTEVKGTFTERQSNDLFELMRFSVKLVVDAQALPIVIGGLSLGNFHVPLNVQYEAVPPNEEMVGKIYGDDPVVELTIDFDTVFFSELYVPLMPPTFLELLGKQRPEAVPGEGV